MADRERVVPSGACSMRRDEGAQDSSCAADVAESVAAPRRRGYVGEGSPAAREYHSRDFPWESLCEEGRAAVARQRAEFAAHMRSSLADGAQAEARGEGGQARATGQVHGAGADAGCERSWEAFHQRHSAARFFKEKRYLTLEFPALLGPGAGLGGGLHVAEIGCGCGAAVLPVLQANAACRATACDVSPAALRLLRDAAARAGVDPCRLTTFVHDAAAAPAAAAAAGPLAVLRADCLLLVFTLSALPPAAMPTALRQAAAALRPGGLLLLRDYGRYDLAQLRYRGAQLVDPGALLYRRADGTLASFFDPGELAPLVASCGFEVVECEYATVARRNRKTGAVLRRVFVHGVFRRRG